MSLFPRFLRSRSGAAAIEYALIAALISVFLVGVVTLVGQRLDATFVIISEGVARAVAGAATTPVAPPGPSGPPAGKGTPAGKGNGKGNNGSGLGNGGPNGG